MDRNQIIEEIEQEITEEPLERGESLRQRAKKAKKAKRKEMLRAAVDTAKKQTAESFKKGAGKPVLKISLALVAVILLIFVPVATLSGDEEEVVYSETAVLQVFQEGNTNYAYLLNGEKLVLDDVEVHIEAESADKTTVCYSNENDELVVLKDGKAIKTGIEEAKGIKVSSAGDTFLYYSDCKNVDYLNTLLGYGSGTETGTLHLYYIKKGKDVVIANDVLLNSGVLSPNGETVAYVAEYEADDDFKGFYIVNGKRPIELGKEKRVFAIADKGAYVYYTDDDRLYAKKKKREGEKLASDTYSTSVLLNADCTELLYITDSKTYLTVNAEEKQKISGKELDSMLVKSDAVIGFDMIHSDKGTIRVTYTSVETFKEQIFFDRAGHDMVYLLDTLETERLASSAFWYAVSDNGKKLVYLDDGEVVEVTDFTDGGAKQDLTDEAEAKELYAGKNLKYVYYLNNDAELFCIKGSKEKRIASDVTSVVTSADGIYCYYVTEGEKLCYTKNGKKGKTLFEEEDATITLKLDSGAVIAKATNKETITLYRVKEKEIEAFYTYEETAQTIEDILKEKYGLDEPLDSILN